MKKLCTHVLIALVGLVSKSYAQEGFYYQAMLRNSDGSPVKTQPVTLELSILKQNEVSYHESHELTTSENGFIHATFGSGLVHLGALDTIDWSEALSLKESIALNGSMLISSIKPILKTPRAYVADKALSIAPNAISDEHLSINAQISFEKLKISRADIESLGIIDTDTDTTYEVGDNGLSEKNFTAELKTKLEGIEAASDVTDTQNVVAALTAGTNISIAADGTISATDTDTTYSAGNGLTLTGTTLAIDNTVVTNTYSGTVAASAFSGDGSGLTNLQNLSDNSVSTVKIQDASITPAKLANAAVESSALADGSVTSSKLVDNGITNSTIADGVITAAKIDGGNFISGTQLNSLSALTSEGDGEVIILENNGPNNDYPIMLLGKAELTGTDPIFISIPATFPLKSSTMMFTTISGGTNIAAPGITCKVDVANSKFEVYALESYSTSTTTFNFMIVNFN